MNEINKMYEQAIRNTIGDFQKFCRYIKENNPVLTKQKIQLGKKDLFKINALLHFRKDVTAPNYQQESYPFFMDAKRYSRNAFQSPNCEEGPYVDKVNIGELELYEGQRILYLFDYGDSWEFNVLLEKIDTDCPLPLNPKITETKGKAPEQYRYF